MKLVSFALIVLTCIFMLGCHSDDVRLIKVNRDERGRILDAFESDVDGLAVRTVNYLNSRLLGEKYYQDPAEVIRFIESEYESDSQPQYLEYITDICCSTALRKPNDEAVCFWLSAAIYARKYISTHLRDDIDPSNICDPGSFVVIRRYNVAITEIFEYLKSKKIESNSGFQLFSAMGEPIYFKLPIYRVPFEPTVITDVEPCASFKVKNLSHYSYWFGVGAPVIVTADQHDVPLEGAKSYRNIRYPATLFLKLEPSTYSRMIFAQWVYISPYSMKTVPIAGKEFPLEMDFSTPLASMLASDEGVGLIDYMLNPSEHKDEEGLYFFDSYDPKKIPVVFVHGLMSSARTWVQMINTLKNDELIRDNYQFWFYTYSSGRPVLLSAANMRMCLDSCYRSAQPDTEAFDNMILVGHSMGGLLSRLMISSNDTTLIQERFNISFDSAILSSPAKNFLSYVFDFAPRPYIKRVVFMAVPHQGSDLATWWFSKIGASLISIPSEVVDFNRSVIRWIKKADIPVEKIHSFETGIDNLSPESKFVKALAQMPMSPDIPVHSVMGNRDAADVPGGSDGIVPYESSHLDVARSERVVQSNHSVQTHPITIQEMRRILRLHLARIQHEKEKEKQ